MLQCEFMRRCTDVPRLIPQSYPTPPAYSPCLGPSATDTQPNAFPHTQPVSGPSCAGPNLSQEYQTPGTFLDTQKINLVAASHDGHACRGHVELVDDPQNDCRVDAVVEGEEGGRGGVDGGWRRNWQRRSSSRREENWGH